MGNRTGPGRLGYQPSLDGIRAVAVLAVMVFHDNELDFLHGGFLGVDVFFVLSGFLITTLLLADHDRTGTTVSGRFWIRRIRRLLPAFLIMLALVAVYAWTTAVPSEAHELRRTGLAALAYVSNWQQVYYSTHVSTLLAHTWSLSVEEQWYLVWPFGLAALLWLSRGRTWVLAAGIGVLTAVSAGLMAYFFHAGANLHAFFGTDTRAWELLAGALLAVVLASPSVPPARSRPVRYAIELAGLAGLAAVIWSFVALRNLSGDLYPGYRLLLVFGAVLMILGGVQANSPVLGRALAWRPVVGIGLISYGLYLFHVPLFWWMSPDRMGFDGFPLTAVRFLVVFAVAIASYVLVEQPIRRGANLPVSNPLVALAAAAAVGLAFLTATLVTRPENGAALTLSHYRELAATTPSGAQRVLVVGDASAYDLGAQLPSPVDRDGIRGTVAAGCGLAPGTPMIGNQVVREPCQPWRAAFGDARDAFRPDVVVLMTGTTEMFDRRVGGVTVRAGTPAAARGLVHGLDDLRRLVTRKGTKLIVLTVPCQDAAKRGPAFAAVRADPARLAWVNGVVRGFAAAHPAQVSVADLGAVLCPAGNSHAALGAYPFRPDGVDLSPTGASLVWQWLAPIARTTAGVAAAAP